MRVTGLLVMAMYLLAIVGIDIHSDYEHGHTYVISALSDNSCENIHPEHHCHDHHGAGCSETSCISDEVCCEDCFLILHSATNVVPDISVNAPERPVTHISSGGSPAATGQPEAFPSFSKAFHSPPPERNVIRKYCTIRA